MYRCLATAVASLALSAPAFSQAQRNFPANALRGSISFGTPPQIMLNGQPARLSPGARIRGFNNLLEMSGSLAGRKETVNFTLDNSGLVHEVWLLRPEEAAVKPWPATPEQARTWEFDPVDQTWTRR